MRLKKHVVIPAGSTFTISTGEYSDYSVHGVFRALKDIDCDILIKQWLEKYPDQIKDYDFDDQRFIGSCFQQGYFESIDSYKWHVCNYSKISEMEVTEPYESWYMITEPSADDDSCE